MAFLVKLTLTSRGYWYRSPQTRKIQRVPVRKYKPIEKERTDGKMLVDTVQKIDYLRELPNKLSLKIGNPNLAVTDIQHQRIEALFPAIALGPVDSFAAVSERS